MIFRARTSLSAPLPHMPMDKTSALDALQQWCSDSRLAFDATARDRFSRYIDLLLHYQEQTNLTGFSTPDALVHELFIDSLQLLRTSPIDGPALDVGTGAGFPAIPLKILHPDIAMLLVEPRQKRYAFLRIVERELGLGNISIHRSRIENVAIPPDLRFAVSKAFAPLPDWLALARPWARQGARIGCYASRRDWQSLDFAAAGYRILHAVEQADRVYGVVAAEDSRRATE